MQALYEVDSTNHPVGDVLRRILDEPPADNTGSPVATLADPSGREFARKLVDGVLSYSAELDAIIARSAPNWTVDQMSRIDKNILRLAIFEILFDNMVPLKAAINEAVELGKRFGSDSSSRFINGVLGTVAAEREALGRQVAKRSAARREESMDREEGMVRPEGTERDVEPPRVDS